MPTAKAKKLIYMEEKSMNVYETKAFSQAVEGNTYPGRGIVVGKSADGKKAVVAYFIMGRSVNSRNRVFEKTEDGVIIHAFDPSKLEDPSLVIYSPVRCYKNNQIVTNGDQTDTVYNCIEAWDKAYSGILGGTDTHLQSMNEVVVKNNGQLLNIDSAFEAGLSSRDFEPDGPNWTPRISGMLTFDKLMDFTYKLHICKSADAEGTECNRYCFSYKALAGLGHFIHTYNCDGNPIPTFTGEPERIAIPDDIDAFTNEIWNSLDANNKVSLYVCYTNLENGEKETRIINANVK